MRVDAIWDSSTRRDSHIARSLRNCDIRSRVAGSVSGGREVVEVREGGISTVEDSVGGSGSMGWGSFGCSSAAGSGGGGGGGGVGSLGGMTDMSGVSVREGASSSASIAVDSTLTGDTGNFGVSVRIGELGTLTFSIPFKFVSAPSSVGVVPVSTCAPAFGDPVLLFAIDAARRSCNVILPMPPVLFCGSFFAAARLASRATISLLARGCLRGMVPFGGGFSRTRSRCCSTSSIAFLRNPPHAEDEEDADADAFPVCAAGSMRLESGSYRQTRKNSKKLPRNNNPRRCVETG